MIEYNKVKTPEGDFMLITDTNIANEYYFGAANGYCGFINSFDNIFSPGDYRRIFIIKGGPGTGKSSLMKSVAEFSQKTGCYTEAILCSSDPESLDGIVVHTPKGKIALIDGTSPHATEARYPGAVEELVDLGAGFNVKLLEEEKSRIISLNSEKKGYYDEAYRLLYLAGGINDSLRQGIENKARSTINQAVIDITRLDNSRPSLNKKIKYLSSFSRLGYESLPLFDVRDRTKISIRGNGHTEFILMKKVYETLRDRIKTICPSPFRKKDLEAIYTDNLLIYISGDGAVDSTEFFDLNLPFYTQLEKIENDLLSLAKESLGEASKRHFSLEDIYKKAMNFANNKKLGERIKDFISACL
jgi:hypothetical protein